MTYLIWHHGEKSWLKDSRIKEAFLLFTNRKKAEKRAALLWGYDTYTKAMRAGCCEVVPFDTLDFPLPPQRCAR